MSSANRSTKGTAWMWDTPLYLRKWSERLQAKPIMGTNRASMYTLGVLTMTMPPD